MTKSNVANFPTTLLAPMEGVSSPRTRELIQSYAPIGLVCTPFIRITDHVPSESYLRSLVQRERVQRVSVQLMGSNAPHLALAAKILRDAGVDTIDLNFGCPSRQVMRKGVGAALLSQPVLIGQIIQAVRSAGSGRLSAKIRGGVDGFDEALEIAKIAEDAGVDFLTVHPRAGTQGYAGVADWRYTRRVKAALRIPVIGNGDIWYAADALRLMAWSRCDGIMIGRGCLRNPWIFQQFNALRAGTDPVLPTATMVIRHLHRLAAIFEDELDPKGPRPLGALKEQAKYLLMAAPMPLGAELLKRMLSATSMLELLDVVKALEGALSLDLGATGTLSQLQTATHYCDPV